MIYSRLNGRKAFTSIRVQIGPDPFAALISVRWMNFRTFRANRHQMCLIYIVEAVSELD